MRSHRALPRLSCIAILATVLSACSEPAPPPAAPRPVVVMTVGENREADLQIYSGEVRARHEVDLSFRVGGKLAERKVNAGEMVRKGQILARLDPEDAGLSAAAARAQVAAAEADLNLSRNEYERARSLHEQRFLSASAVDVRRAQMQVAESRLKQAQAQASVSGNQLGYTTLAADRAGIVTAAPAEAGEVLAAGQVVVRLADPTQREVLIWIPESRIASVKVGRAAIVRPWNARERTLTGKVREVAGSADVATRTYAVRVTVDQADDSLSLGSTAAVGFPDKAETTALSVPLPAVVSKEGKSHVWVVASDGSTQLRAVEVGSLRDDAALIRAGLKKGEQVVIAGAHALTAGMRVKPVRRDAPVAIDVKR